MSGFAAHTLMISRQSSKPTLSDSFRLIADFAQTFQLVRFGPQAEVGRRPLLGGQQPAQIAADTVQGRLVSRVDEVVIQLQELGISLACGQGQTGAARPCHRAGE